MEKGDSSTKAQAGVKDKERERTRTRISSSSGKRQKKIDAFENQDPQQNPNPDAFSPSSCHEESTRREQVDSDEAVRRREEPVGEEAVEEGTPEWLVNVMEEVNGVDAKKIFTKVLTKSDVAKSQTRFLIPWNQILDMDFLTEDELNTIDEHYKKNRDKGMDVIVFDFRCRKWDLNFKRWDMRSNSYYVLTTGWSKLVASNSLEKGDSLHLWTFRSPDNLKLFFALVPQDPAPDPAPGSPRAPVATRDSELIDVKLEGCEVMIYLDSLLEANRRSSLVSVTESDLELRL